MSAYTVRFSACGGVEYRDFEDYAEATAFAAAVAGDGDDAFVYRLQQEYFGTPEPPYAEEPPARAGVNFPATLFREERVTVFRRAG